MRRNAALVLIYLSAVYSAELRPPLNTQKALPELSEALEDPDKDVRGWAAHAIAEIGPNAKDAIPSLIRLLKDPEEGPRNTSCIALGRIGPAAKEALFMLREALRDPSKDVRRFAQQAIDKIQKK
jgi:HEAT repeat protein